MAACQLPQLLNVSDAIQFLVHRCLQLHRTERPQPVCILYILYILSPPSCLSPLLAAPSRALLNFPALRLLNFRDRLLSKVYSLTIHAQSM